MTVKTCPKCNEDNTSTAVICISCGATLPICEAPADTENIKEPGKIPEKKSFLTQKWLVAFILLALLAVFALLFYILAVR